MNNLILTLSWINVLDEFVYKDFGNKVKEYVSTLEKVPVATAP